MTIDAAIIGGGVSGLSVAYGLRARGHRVAVLERQVRTGGNAVSERFGGFLMEHGPSSVNAAVSAAVDLSAALGLDAERRELGGGVKARYLVGGGKLRGISTHPLGFLCAGYLSPLARLRMLAEIAVPRRRDHREETVAGFWSRRFGHEFADKVIDPLVGGLYAGRASELSMESVFPAVAAMERRYGSVTGGILAKRLTNGKMPGRRLFSWRDGIGTLPTALTDSLGEAVRTGVVVTAIERGGCGFRIKTAGHGTLRARIVVVATQPHVAAGLLESVDPVAAEAAAGIAAPPLAVVFLGYRREQVAHPLDGLGYLTPSGENRVLSGALFCSTMFADRAPEGHVALAGYVGGARAPEAARLDSGAITALARDEFRNLLGARGEPVVSRVRHWPRGLPQLRAGHRRRIEAIRGAERRHPGLFLTGNYFTGPAVATCVDHALRTCERVADHATAVERPAAAARPPAERSIYRRRLIPSPIEHHP